MVGQKNGSPEEDAAVVAGTPVVTAPSEALVVHGEVLSNGEDRVGQPLHQRLTVPLPHVGGLDPGEAFVEVDVEAAIVLRDDLHGDVGVIEADGDAQVGIDFMGGKGAVRRPDDALRHVPRRADVAH